MEVNATDIVFTCTGPHVVARVPKGISPKSILDQKVEIFFNNESTPRLSGRIKDLIQGEGAITENQIMICIYEIPGWDFRTMYPRCAVLYNKDGSTKEYPVN